MKKQEKYLKGNDIFLNLYEIEIDDNNGFSSISFSGPASFYFEGETRHGCVDDPRFVGKIKILDTKKEGKNYILKVKLEPKKEESEE